MTGSRFINSPCLILRYKISKTPEKRFTIVISKNIIKKATNRNLLRRRVYSIIQKNLTSVKNGVFGIFLAKKGVEKLKFIELKEEIIGLLKKAGLTRNYERSSESHENPKLRKSTH